MDIKPQDIPDELQEEALAYRMEFDPREHAPASERWEKFEAWLQSDSRHAIAYQMADDTYNWCSHVFGPRRRKPRPS